MNETAAVSHTSAPAATSCCQGFSLWTWAATVTAVLALAGSLLLSLGLGLKACPLCYYQRTFVMGVVAILLMGLVAGAGRPGFLSLLALPLAVGGLAVAGYHEYLEQKGALECPLGLLQLGTAPQQSLAVLAVLVVLLLLDVVISRAAGGFAWPAAAGTVVLGVLLAVAGVLSASGAPEPTAAYRLPVDEDGCRPPFVPNR